MEAGLRTYDLDSPYPEELNRQAVGVLAKYNFAPPEQAKQNLAAEVVQLVGGTENISSVAHCMIRLRFAVKDLNKADQEALKKIPGVLSVTPAA